MMRQGWKRWLRVFRDPGREVDEEMRFHMSERVEELVRQGLGEDDAHRQALAEFGDPAHVREQLVGLQNRAIERRRRENLITSFIADVKYGARALALQPAFTIAAVVTLALGIGANAAVFGLLDRLLFRAAPGIVNPDRVVRLHFKNRLGPSKVIMDASSYPMYATLRDHAKTLSDVAWYMTMPGSLGRGAEARRIRRTLATAGFFPLIGVKPALGRFFSPAEDALPDGVRVVVLTHSFWESAFGSDPGVLGRAIRLDNHDYTIIGVAQRDFAGIDLEPTDMFVPMSAGASEGRRPGRRAWYEPDTWTGPRTIARLRDGIDARAAEAEINALLTSVPGDPRPEAAYVKSVIPGRSVPQEPPMSATLGQRARIAQWMAGMSVVVLLIACSNVANLYLTRAWRRRRDFAVRLALGAGRARLVRQLLTEGLLVAVAAAMLGLVLAAATGGVLRHLLLGEGSWSGGVVDLRVLAVTTLLVVVTTLLTSLLPAAQGTSRRVTNALRTGARAGTRQSRLRTALLIGQISLCAILLVLAGVFVSSLDRAAHVDLGFDGAHGIAVAFNPPNSTDEQRTVFWQEATRRIAGLPGVHTVARTNSMPFYSAAMRPVRVPGRDTLPFDPQVVTGDASLMKAMGLQLRRGRLLTASDAPEAAIVINETTARRMWAGADALQGCAVVSEDADKCVPVVGIVRDVKWFGLDDANDMQIYMRAADASDELRTLLVRTDGDPAELVAAIRRELLSLSPDAGNAHIEPIPDAIGPHLQPFRLGAAVFTAFGVIALLIAGIGLYGVIAYQVGERMHEFGVRLALGATPGALLRSVVRRGSALGLVGVAIGVAVAVPTIERVKPLLFNVDTIPLPVLLGVPAVLFSLALIASSAPARRAMSADPVQSLKAE